MVNIYQIDSPKYQCHRKTCALSENDLNDLLISSTFSEEDKATLRGFEQAIHNAKKTIESNTLEHLKKYASYNFFNGISDAILSAIISETISSILSCNYTAVSLHERLSNFREYQKHGINVKNIIILLNTITFSISNINSYIWANINQVTLSTALQKCIQLEYTLFAQCAVCRVVLAKEQQKIAFHKHEKLLKRKFVERHSLLENEVKKMRSQIC